MINHFRQRVDALDSASRQNIVIVLRIAKLSGAADLSGVDVWMFRDSLMLGWLSFELPMTLQH